MDDDTVELIQLLGRIMRALKKPGHGGTGPPKLVVRLKEAGLGPRHMPVLMTLITAGPSAVGELAARVGLGAATTSQLVGELQRAGLVERGVDERDRRRALVRIAEPWRAEAEEVLRTRLDPARRMLAALTPVEREHFLRGLRLLVEEQEAQDDQTGCGAP
ncbi:MarR family winged helix-turn-helix transcriptional regulator [Actinomadura atramentaria]|uniref:MarR family winged helix-turn-helix transcriptional regulator n=1 Tax=Actinomadura atramentaria TaxID=1990 RepID=UPI0003620755|nr:MarR family winged helix-turn-helix transcriptional regulator [Actinomadura atramentaria]